MKRNTKHRWGYDIADMDDTVRPQDDFYRYAVGGWIARTTIPPSEVSWGRFSILRKENMKRLVRIAQAAAAADETSAPRHIQLVGALYRSGMDAAARNKAGFSAVSDWLKRVEDVDSPEAMSDIVADMHRHGLQGPWAINVGPDEKKSDRNITYLTQSGLSLPDTHYYLDDDKDKIRVRDSYHAYIVRLCRASGSSADEARAIAESVLKIETELARVSMDHVQLRDIAAQYHKMKRERVEKLAAPVPILHYLRQVNLAREDYFIVAQPDFFKRLGQLVREVPMDEWRRYLRFKVLDGTARHLGARQRAIAFDFYGKLLSGARRQKPLHEQVVATIDGLIGEALGRAYVAEYFSPAAKRRVTEMVENLCEVFGDRIKRNSWMGEATKKRALKKLRRIERKLGYPNKWKTYAGLTFEDAYLTNIFNAHRWHFRDMVRRAGKPVDKSEWHMTPPTVNAYYHPNYNEIVFPAGIMQPPFFNPDIDDEAVNYGAIGAVIGHEISHAFDDQGKNFDEKGTMRNWWTPEDKERFEAYARKLIRQYNRYEALPGVPVNGALTVGENIADIGGVSVAYEAYLRTEPDTIIDGFTPAQRFFLGWALVWCSVVRPEYARMLVSVDPHAPPHVRVNGVLSNVAAFHEAFGVKRGDKLYRPPASRISLW